MDFVQANVRRFYIVEREREQPLVMKRLNTSMSDVFQSPIYNRVTLPRKQTLTDGWPGYNADIHINILVLIGPKPTCYSWC